MKVVPPIEITPAKMIASNVPETDYPLWAATTTYPVGTRVMLDHRNYESLIAHSNRNPQSATVTPPA